MILSTLGVISLILLAIVILYAQRILKYADYIPIWKNGWTFFIAAMLFVLLRRTIEMSDISIIDSEYITFSLVIVTMIFLLIFIKNVAEVFRNISTLNKESRFSTLVKHLPAGIVVYDEGSSIIYANSRASEILGLTQNLEGYYDRDLDKTLHFTREYGTPLPESEYPVNVVLRSGEEFYHHIYGVSTKNGQKWVLCNAYMTSNGTRQVAVVFIDITELKNSQLQCKISEDMYKKAFMASHDAVVISRLKDGKIYSINRSFTNFAGYTEEDLKDKTVFDINLWKNSEDRKKYISSIKECGLTRDLDSHFNRKDGTDFHGLVSGTIVKLNGEECLLTSVKEICSFPKNRRKEDKK